MDIAGMLSKIDITLDLIVLGGVSSFLVEFLRALILKIEDHPRLKAVWKYLPPLFGAALILLYPSAVKAMSTLLLLAHGAASPAAFYAAYPLLKKAAAAKLNSALPPSAPTNALPDKEPQP